MRAVLLPRPPNPIRAAVRGRHLVGFDDNDKETWQADFTALFDTAPGRTVWVGDLDGDGDNEVLFAYTPDRQNSSTLICYSRSGRERWRFNGGRPIRLEGKNLEGPFHTAAIMVDRLGKNGEYRVAVSNTHYLYFPCQLALLDSNGVLRGEYWHSGHLPALLAYRMQEGMRLLAGGVANARKVSTLVVLDPDNMRGASVEDNPKYQIDPFERGSEIARLFFPRTPIADVLTSLPHVQSLWTEDGGFVAETANLNNADAGLYYHFGPGLTLRRLATGTSFQEVHRRLEMEGKLHHPLDDMELNELSRIQQVP